MVRGVDAGGPCADADLRPGDVVLQVDGHAVASRVDLNARLADRSPGARIALTVHDLAFRHDPGQFTRRGVRMMNRSLEVIGRRADRIICSSRATFDDCVRAGLDESRGHLR